MALILVWQELRIVNVRNQLSTKTQALRVRASSRRKSSAPWKTTRCQVGTPCAAAGKHRRAWPLKVVAVFSGVKGSLLRGRVAPEGCKEDTSVEPAKLLEEPHSGHVGPLTGGGGPTSYCMSLSASIIMWTAR